MTCFCEQAKNELNEKPESGGENLPSKAEITFKANNFKNLNCTETHRQKSVIVFLLLKLDCPGAFEFFQKIVFFHFVDKHFSSRQNILNPEALESSIYSILGRQRGRVVSCWIKSESEICIFIIWLNWSMVKRSILIGSLSGPNFAIGTAKMDRLRTGVTVLEKILTLSRTFFFCCCLTKNFGGDSAKTA